MSFDPSNDKPLGDQWHSEAQMTWLEGQREVLTEKFGEEAVESVMQMVALFADLMHVGSDNVPLIKAGVTRMAELVNQMLPRLRAGSPTRTYDERDLNGALGEIPAAVQRIFIAIVGDVLLHAKGGPFDSAVNINEAVDRLAGLVKERG